MTGLKTYADDTALLADNNEDLQILIQKVQEESLKGRLSLKHQENDSNVLRSIRTLQIGWRNYWSCWQFYLPCNQSREGCAAGIKRRIVLGKTAISGLDKMRKDKDISKTAKMRVIASLVFPVVMYGSECWTVKKADRQKLSSFEMWCWRRMLNNAMNSQENKPVSGGWITTKLLPGGPGTQQALSYLDILIYPKIQRNGAGYHAWKSTW